MQGKYPLLTTINHYMNPGLKLKRPSYIIGKNKSEPADVNVFKPKQESDFIVPANKEIDTLSSKLLSKTNMFSLLNNERNQNFHFLHRFEFLYNFFLIFKRSKFTSSASARTESTISRAHLKSSTFRLTVIVKRPAIVG